MAQTWRISPAGPIEVNLDASSLDAVTRQLPQGFYSTFRTYDECKRVLGLASHVRRLYDPVATAEVDAGSLRWQLRALLKPYRPREARVRLVMTRQGQAYIAIEPLHPLPPKVYEQGVRAETTELHREHPRLKSTGFIGRSDPERKHIATEGIFEALLVKEGKILEGMTSNFFYVLRPAPNGGMIKHRESLCTALDDILLGVTRETVIEIARGRGLEVMYQPLQPDQLSATAEAFITSSSRGIVPIIQIDGVMIGQGRPGPITKELIEAYERYVIEHSEEI